MTAFYIRKLIREALGVFLPIDQLAEHMSEGLYNYMENKNNEKEQIPDRFHTDFFDNTQERNRPLSLIVPVNIRSDKFPLYMINVHLQTDKNKSLNDTSGSFNANMTRSSHDGFIIEMDLVLSTVYNDGIKPKLASVFSHELHHFYTRINKANKPSITQNMHKSRNAIKGYDIILNANPAIKDFVNAFYYSLDEEINARVQQLMSDMKPYTKLSYDELVQKFTETGIFDDIEFLKKFNSKHITDNVPEKTQDNFIRIFNDILKHQDVEMPYPKTSREAFWKFWEERFHRKGDKLLEKCIKQLQNIKNIVSESTENPMLFSSGEFLQYDTWEIIRKRLYPD